jgi:hypothetical protein
VETSIPPTRRTFSEVINGETEEENAAKPMYRNAKKPRGERTGKGFRRYLKPSKHTNPTATKVFAALTQKRLSGNRRLTPNRAPIQNQKTPQTKLQKV